jgi:cysteinyl-tRNA synthetase
VDDKIILRARQRHLLEQFKSKHSTLDETTARAAWKAYVAKNLELIPVETTTKDFKAASELAYKNVLENKSLDGTAAPGDAEAKIKMHLRTAEAAADGLEMLATSKFTSQDELYAKVDDVLLPYLDDLYGSKIDASDHSKYCRRFEDFPNF